MDKFEKFYPIIDKYMQNCGEGETMTSQIVTAVNKLIYKWYNDGDVYDNTHFLDGWANDLSDYANWLYKYMDENTKQILKKIFNCLNSSDYENLLLELSTYLLNENFLQNYNVAKNGSIYDCDGIFEFIDKYEDCDDEEDY